MANTTVDVLGARGLAYIGRSNLHIDKSTGEIKAFDVTSISLDDAIADNPEMAARVVAYKEQLQDFKLARRAAYPQNKGSEKEQYLQQSTCRKCHTDAWEAYASSAHKHAYATPARQGAQLRPRVPGLPRHRLRVEGRLRRGTAVQPADRRAVRGLPPATEPSTRATASGPCRPRIPASSATIRRTARTSTTPATGRRSSINPKRVAECTGPGTADRRARALLMERRSA